MQMKLPSNVAAKRPEPDAAEGGTQSKRSRNA